ncbi:hypothetical protein J5J10_04230 [Ciceribacter sp. L1K23]|uniref:hypothetical protein n=1 Tax=Ciceribacter sp. L1K23 TaxID=2820276 RepID=UPI001B812E17|nr:hypothetical protein [Ciceribacter sp. L1K23]MBR0554880.1 hypothetical protein [Ciceribacter sp. L1K23]
MFYRHVCSFPSSLLRECSPVIWLPPRLALDRKRDGGSHRRCDVWSSPVARGNLSGSDLFPFRRSVSLFSRASFVRRINHERRNIMLKFIGGTIGAIFLIGLIVVVLLLMLIF